MQDFFYNFKFNYRILKKVIMVAPRKSKLIKKLYLNYADSTLNNNGGRTIKYRFRNALWYTVNGEKTFDNVFALSKNISEVSLIVHGLNETCTYILLLKPDYIDIVKVTRSKP